MHKMKEMKKIVILAAVMVLSVSKVPGGFVVSEFPVYADPRIFNRTSSMKSDWSTFKKTCTL